MPKTREWYRSTRANGPSERLLEMWVDTKVVAALERLAEHHHRTPRDVLERFLVSEDARIASIGKGDDDKIYEYSGM